MVNSKLTIAVLIITFKRSSLLKKCLVSIKNQVRPPDHIIIVEKTNKDSSPAKNILKDIFPKNIRITYKKLSKGNVSVSRNLALKNAQEDIILFIDDDVIVDKKYINDLLTIYKNNFKKHSVVGKILPTKQEFWQIFINHLITANVTNSNKPQVIDHWPTLNFSIRMKCLNLTKLKFNENYTALEDMDFCLRLKLAGYKIHYTPHLLVQHKYENTIAGFVNKFKKYFRNVAQFNKDHIDKKIFNTNLFLIKNTFKSFYYIKLIKKVIIQSNLFRKQLKLPLQYYLACLTFHYALYLGFKNSIPTQLSKSKIN